MRNQAMLHNSFPYSHDTGTRLQDNIGQGTKDIASHWSSRAHLRRAKSNYQNGRRASLPQPTAILTAQLQGTWTAASCCFRDGAPPNAQRHSMS